MGETKRFILVHGALHGAWCWDKLTPFLTGLGHSVLAVDLPGRNGKGKPGWGLTLQDYIEDLADTVDLEPGKVILVGHSLGGMSISGVAERLPHKVERLIYLTAWVPMDGKNLAQLAKDNKPSELHQGTGSSLLKGIITPAMAGFREAFCADCSDDDWAWAQQRLVPESIRTALGRVALSPERFGSVPASYLCCADDKALSPLLQRRMASSIGCAHPTTLPSSHSPFMSMPQRLAQTLHQAVQ